MDKTDRSLQLSRQLSRQLSGFQKLPGRFKICIEGSFDSAHYLYQYLPNGEDEPLHGHSWRVQVIIAPKGGVLQESGISYDFLAVRNRFDQLLERIGHLCINDLQEFKGVNPTAENVARWFYQGLQDAVEKQNGHILEIRLHEKPGNVAIFEPL